jgi:hypothetical protein
VRLCGSRAVNADPTRQTVRPLELGALAALYCAAHLPFLAPSLEDIDSINFALGLRDFEVAEHQPHPPGYPLYIGFGRIVLAALRAVRPDLPPVTAEAQALSLLSVVAGAAAVVLAGSVFTAVMRETVLATPDPRRVVRWSTVFLTLCPLFWLTGARPMSDMPGLAAAFGAQALLLRGYVGWGAITAGLALGIRVQIFWLTAPLLVWGILRGGPGVHDRLGAGIRGLAAFAAGALVWAIPLVAVTGGLDAYFAALGTQAGEDFAFVDMLWTNPTPRRLAFGLVHTLVLPWSSVPLAALMATLAVLGALVLLARDRRTLAPVVMAFAPYAAFHLVFQETLTVRYALPVVPAIAFLAARLVATAGRATNVVAAPLAAFALVAAMPGLVAYGRDVHPAFRAVEDAQRRAETTTPAVVTSHFELRRTLQALAPTGLPIAWAPRHREWLTMVEYWRGGGREPVWFLANPRRTDLALIDPQSLTDVVRYRWAAAHRTELSGTRPAGTDWYRLRPPGWFLGEGWSLTAEAGGLTNATATGPSHRPISGYVRCRAEPMHMVIGGRHLGGQTDRAASFELQLGGVVLDRWTLTYDDRNFLRFLDLPGGCTASDGYGTLTVAARAAGADSDRSGHVPVAVRQFDFQPATRVIFGFGPGWHEHEWSWDTGLAWRWASDRSVLRVRAPAGPVRVRIRGESPLRYFDEPPTMTLSAGGHIVGRLQPATDFEFDAIVPADAMRASGGDLVLETSRSFVPALTGRSVDVRRLGLRIFDVRVERAR